jgi:uncharacterized coiled-coil protein SlyX
MIPQMEKYLLSNWSLYFESQPRDLQFLMISNPQGKKITHAKCTVLVFKNKEKIPSLVCKFLRVNRMEQDKLIDESELLSQLKGMDVPKVFPYFKIDQKTVTVEEYKKGNSIKRNLQLFANKYHFTKDDFANLIKNDFNSIGIFLDKFKNKVSMISFQKNKKYSYINHCFSNKNSLFEYLGISDHYRNRLNEILEDYTKRSSFQKDSLVHFDLTPSNLIRNEGKFYLIDWEFGSLSPHGFIDLFRFAYYYFEQCYLLGILPYSTYEECFRYFFIEDSEIHSIVFQFFTQLLDITTIAEMLSLLCIFLLSNLQLQRDETETPNSNIILHTKNALLLLIDEIDGKKGNIQLIENPSEKELLQDYTIEDLKRMIIENRDYIAKCHSVIEEKDRGLLQNIDYIAKCHTTIANKDQQLEQNVTYIAKCNETISRCNEVIAKKDQDLEQMKGLIDQLSEELERLKSNYDQKNKRAKETLRKVFSKIKSLK